MDYFTLKTLHVAAGLLLFTSLGASLLGAAGRRGSAALHGISLLLLLLVGFAMLREPPMDQYWWMVKVLLWLFLGLAPLLARKKLLPGWAVLVLSLAAGTGAAWLAIVKPF